MRLRIPEGRRAQQKGPRKSRIKSPEGKTEIPHFFLPMKNENSILRHWPDLDALEQLLASEGL